MVSASTLRRDFDFVILASAMLLTALGVFAIYSATYDIESGTASHIYQKQLVWIALAAAALIIAALTPLRALYSSAYLIYGGCLALLVLVLLLPRTWPASRWIALGPLRIQPSEFAKVGSVLALARYLSSQRVLLHRLRFLFVPFGLVALPMLLILEEPDLGTALVFAALPFPMLFWAGLKPLYLFFLLVPLLSAVTSFHWLLWLAFVMVLCALFLLARPRTLVVVVMSVAAVTAGVATPALYRSLHEYQRQRVEAFVNPAKDPLGSGYQIIQSKVAIGSGGVTGKGFLKGTQTKLAFLPNQHTDFVFSVIGEELGFLGALAVLVVYLLIFWRGILLAAKAASRFAALVSIGGVSVLAFHVLVNIGMTIGLAPVTGIPLPLLSYGGSSLISSAILLGLILNVGLRRFEY